MNRQAMRPVLLPLFVLPLVLLLTPPLAGAAPQPPRQPGVLFVLIDDLGYADLTCYGEKRVHTDHLDRLAAEGIRFTQFYVNAPICSPSRTALLTGQYPALWKITSFLASRAENRERRMADWLGGVSDSIRLKSVPLSGSGTSYMPHVYLTKSNDDLVSHCRCTRALVSFPPQMDCPWCGCGWLFTCIECRKAFTFARAVEVKESWEELASRDVQDRIGREPSAKEIDEWVGAMQEFLGDAKPGGQYVVFDGRLISTEQPVLNFDGWHATHDLPFVPHVVALRDSSVMEWILSNREYWESHALGEWSPSSLGKPAIRDRGGPRPSWWRRLLGGFRKQDRS